MSTTTTTTSSKTTPCATCPAAEPTCSTECRKEDCKIFATTCEVCGYAVCLIKTTTTTSSSTASSQSPAAPLTTTTTTLSSFGSSTTTSKPVLPVSGPDGAHPNSAAPSSNNDNDHGTTSIALGVTFGAIAVVILAFFGFRRRRGRQNHVESFESGSGSAFDNPLYGVQFIEADNGPLCNAPSNDSIDQRPQSIALYDAASSPFGGRQLNQTEA